jgi:hypothetical protein
MHAVTAVEIAWQSTPRHELVYRLQVTVIDWRADRDDVTI